MDSGYNFQPPIRILSAVSDGAVFSAFNDYGPVSVPWDSITHVCAVRNKRKSNLYYLIFFQESIKSAYLIDSDSFNFKKFLGRSLNKQEKNFFELASVFCGQAPMAFVDWSLRDAFKSGDLSIIPSFPDMAHIMSYAYELRENNKFEDIAEQDVSQDDSPSIIFAKRLEIFRDKREAARLFLAKARDIMSKSMEGNKKDSMLLAITEVDRALETDPSLIAANLFKAELCSSLGKAMDAADSLMDVIVRRPEGNVRSFASSNIYFALAQLFRELGDLPMEREMLSSYYGLFPSKTKDDADLSIVDGGKGDEERQWYMYYVYGHDMYARGEYSTAVEMFNQSISRFSSFRWSYHWKAICFKALGRWSQAIDSFLIADKYGSALVAFMEIAKIQEEQGRFDLAQDYYRKAIAFAPKTPQPYIALARNLLEHTGDESGCFDMILKAVELDPYGDFIDEAQLLVSNMSERVQERKGKPLSERSDMEIGDLFENRYKIREIYKGGMGIVYIVRDNTTMKLYAVKTFQDKFLWNESIVRMFNKEAEVWVRLGLHQNIVQAVKVRDFDGKPYIFLEYIDGVDLEKVLKSGKLYIGQILDYAMQFCRGMDYAYRTMGVIHQDIKPSNCMITKEGILKITDFGLVKIFSDTSAKEIEELNIPVKSSPKSMLESAMLSSSVVTGFYSKIFSSTSSLKHAGSRLKSSSDGGNQIVGTLPYMAPEQLTGDWNISTSTDIYSFGAMLYEMLIGQPPFGNEDPEACIIGHIEEDPVAPMEIRKDIPSELSELVLRCLRKDPSERFEDFGEIFKQLNVIYEEVCHSTYSLGTSLPEEQDSLEAMVFRGEALMVLSKYQEAISVFRKALKLYPSSAAVIVLLGECFRKLGKYEDALNYLNKSLILEPENPDAFYYLGLLYFSLKNIKQAHSFFDKSSKLNPDNADVWLKLGSVYDIANNTDEALRNYDLALKVNPRYSVAWNNKGFLYHRINKFSDAMDCYIKAIEFNPRYYIAWFNQACLQQNLNFNEEAIISFKKVLEINPSYTKALLGMALSYLRLLCFKDALDCYDSAFKLEPHNSSILVMKADCLNLQDLTESAVGCLELALKIEPGNVKALQALVFMLKDLYDYNGALDACNRALLIEPDNNLLQGLIKKLRKRLNRQNFFRNNAYVWFKLGELKNTYSESVVDLKQLIEKHKKSLEKNPESRLVWFRLAILFAFSGLRQEAAEYSKKSLDFSMAVIPELLHERKYREPLDRLLKKQRQLPNPKKVRKFEKIMSEASELMGKKEYTKALMAFQKIIKEDWSNVDIWYQAALCKYHSESYVEAMELIAQGLARNPLDLNLWTLKAFVYRRLNQFKYSLDMFYTALAIDPSFSQALIGVINIFEEFGYSSKAGEFAADYLTLYQTLSEERPEESLVVAIIFFIQSRYEACESFLKKYLDKYPSSLPAKFLSAYVFLRRKKYDEASRKFMAIKNSFAMNENDRMLSILLLGYSYFKLEKYDESIELFGRIPPAFEYFVFAVYFKTIAMSKSEKNIKNGKFFIASLLDNYASNHLFWEAQGQLQAETRYWDAALWSFNKSLELNQWSYSALLNKGIILNKLQQSSEAISVFDSILSFVPNNHTALLLKSVSLYLSGDYEASIELADHLLKLNSKMMQIFHCKALAMYKMDDMEGSFKAVEKALENEPYNPDIWNTRGIIMRRRDRLNDEIFSYNRAIELNPKCVTATLNKGIWLMEMQGYEQAHICFDTVLSYSNDNSIAWREKGRCQHEMKRFMDALRCYNIGLQHSPNDFEAYNGKAATLVELGKFDEALHFLEKSLEHHPSQTHILNNKGVLLVLLGQYEQAYQSFITAYEQEDIFDYVIHNLVLLLLETGKEEEASVYGQRLIDIGTNLNYPVVGKSVMLFAPYRKQLVPFVLSDLKDSFDVVISELPYLSVT